MKSAENSKGKIEKRQKSATPIYKKQIKRKLSFSRTTSFNKPQLGKREMSKSTVSRRLTTRKTEDDSFQPTTKLGRSSNMNSMTDLHKERSKEFSLNSREFKNAEKGNLDANQEESLSTL
jgi:hypothetical protein